MKITAGMGLAIGFSGMYMSKRRGTSPPLPYSMSLITSTVVVRIAGGGAAAGARLGVGGAGTGAGAAGTGAGAGAGAGLGAGVGAELGAGDAGAAQAAKTAAISARIVNDTNGFFHFALISLSTPGLFGVFTPLLYYNENEWKALGLTWLQSCRRRGWYQLISLLLR